MLIYNVLDYDMLSDEIKKEVLKITDVSDKLTDASEPKKDWEILWDNAKTNEFQHMDSLSEKEKKYEGVMFITYSDKNGEFREVAITGQYYFNENDEFVGKMNAFGYDRLPPDVQEALGKREDVVDKWIVWDSSQEELYDAFTYYQRDDSHGYDTWEEYRDAKGFGRQENMSIMNVQEVDEIASPRETPQITKNDTAEISK